MAEQPIRGLHRPNRQVRLLRLVVPPRNLIGLIGACHRSPRLSIETIKAIAHYDNSAQNRLNPAPDQDVLWGPQTWNEMFHAFIEVSLEPGKDRRERQQG